MLGEADWIRLAWYDRSGQGGDFTDGYLAVAEDQYGCCIRGDERRTGLLTTTPGSLPQMQVLEE